MQIPSAPGSTEGMPPSGPSVLVFHAAIAALLVDFFAAMMVLELFFALKIMPESKGSTLEDIEALIVGGTR